MFGVGGVLFEEKSQVDPARPGARRRDL